MFRGGGFIFCKFMKECLQVEDSIVGESNLLCKDISRVEDSYRFCRDASGTVIREEIGLTLDKADKEVLGHAAKVVLTKDSTAIVGDGSIQEAVNKRVAQIRNLIAVGAQTETELKEKKLGVEDTLNATKAAVEEGIVVGGGCTLLRLASKVDAIKETLENDEEKVGADIVKRAMSYPLKLIAKNAGVNGSVVSEKSKHGLEIKQVARLGRTSYHVPGLIEAHVNNIVSEEEELLLRMGNNCRAIGSTNANKHINQYFHWLACLCTLLVLSRRLISVENNVFPSAS
ncbi:UNVERIFIED_CONTAM: RuBisCO large subunit-binding protein subunit beta, chloroplastic [Sesamum radiatum]|uniref:RuBisCO large subunit-binding protein subunit beta, chloroplastic n=1 Tax=Sesamum radiatum TaxID=300843 RepID=A0AAW2JHM7_SESRA